MKKFILIALIILTAQPLALSEEDKVKNVFLAEPEENYELQGFLEYSDPIEENAIFLDSETQAVNIKTPQSIEAKSVLNYPNAINSDFDPFYYNRSSRFSTMEYEIAPISTTLSKKQGNFSFGTSYSSAIDTSQLENSTTFFTRYEWKHFAINTAYSKTLKTSYNSYRDTLYIAPEIKMGKRFAIRDVASSDIQTSRQKNEVVLIYKPKFKNSNSLQFQVGAGQTYYPDSGTKSSVSFSTNFKL